MKFFYCVIFAALSVFACEKKKDATHKHMFGSEEKDLEILSDRQIGKRLWIEVRHGPSRESGWFYPVGYPEFFITNGDTRADEYIRHEQKRKCFCKGEWWLKTNGWVQVRETISRRKWSCSCGEIEYWYRTNQTAVVNGGVK